MTENIKNLFVSNKVRVTIDDDPERVITFNPNDAGLRARILKLSKSIYRKQKEVEKKFKELKKMEGVDEDGLPLNTEPMMKLVLDFSEYMKQEIDVAMGAGTSQKVFEGGFDFDTAVTFLEFVLNQCNLVSKQKVEARLNKPKNKKAMK